MNNLSSIRSRTGAYQNRLEHMVSSLEVTEENLTYAYSRIVDTDMAEEMTEYTKDQVLSQGRHFHAGTGQSEAFSDTAAFAVMRKNKNFLIS